MQKPSTPDIVPDIVPDHLSFPRSPVWTILDRADTHSTMRFQYTQVGTEFKDCVFGKVVQVVEKTPGYYFGFADEVSCQTKTLYKTGRRIFFQKQQRKTSGLYVGPCFLPEETTEPPKVDDMLVGEIRGSKKGLLYTFFACTHTTPLFRFVQYIFRRFTGKVNSKLLYRQLKLDDVRYEDDLWALFLLLSGHVNLFVHAMEQKPFKHPEKGITVLTLSRDVTDFVFLTALFSREVELFSQFRTVVLDRHLMEASAFDGYYDGERRLGGIVE